MTSWRSLRTQAQDLRMPFGRDRLSPVPGGAGYLSLSDIGYGTGAGFQGWNCRHSWNPFFEGISKRSYTKEDIEALNAKDVPYNGGMYTEYEISQMQRRMEREIRATRRELAGLDEAAKFSTGKQKADLQSDFAQSSVKLKRPGSEAAGLHPADRPPCRYLPRAGDGLRAQREPEGGLGE